MAKQKRHVKKRHAFFLKIIQVVVGRIFVRRLKFKGEKLCLKKNQPVFILSNHVSLLDPVLIATTATRPIYFIMVDNMMSVKFLGSAMRALVAPIPIKKGVIDAGTIRECLKVFKEGGNIGLFPSGNTTYSGNEEFVDKKIVKFVRLAKVPLVLYSFENLYGVDPRWGSEVRTGQSSGSIKKTLSVEEIKSLNDDELFAQIMAVIGQSAIKQQEATKMLFKNENSAQFLERALFVCPVCHGISTLKSDKDKFSCQCGFCVRYGDNLKFEKVSQHDSFESVFEWMEWQKKFVLEMDLLANPQKPLIEEEDETLLLNYKNRCKKVVMKKAKVEMYTDRLTVFTKEKEKVFFLSEVDTITLQGKNRVLIYVKGECFQLNGRKRRSALKFVYYFHQLKRQNGEIKNEFLGL